MIKIKEIFYKQVRGIKIEKNNKSTISDIAYVMLLKKRTLYFFNIPIYSSESIIKSNI